MPRLSLFPRIAALAIVTGSVAVLAHAAQPDASRNRPDLATDVEWSRKPTAEDMARTYPARAMDGKIAGRATIQCRVQRNGALTACGVLGEAPRGADFGKAALKLSSKFIMKSSAGSETSIEGKLVRIPLVWRTPGERREPLAAYQVGGGSVLINVLPPGENAPGSIACATAADPARRCALHPFDWVDRPTLDESAPVILATGQTTGLSQLSCLAGADGALTDCKPAGQVSDAASKAMLDFAPFLRAPAAAEDGALLSSGRVIIAFDWASLSQAARMASR